MLQRWRDPWVSKDPCIQWFWSLERHQDQGLLQAPQSLLMLHQPLLRLPQGLMVLKVLHQCLKHRGRFLQGLFQQEHLPPHPKDLGLLCRVLLSLGHQLLLFPGLLAAHMLLLDLHFQGDSLCHLHHLPIGLLPIHKSRKRLFILIFLRWLGPSKTYKLTSACLYQFWFSFYETLARGPKLTSMIPFFWMFWGRKPLKKPSPKKF